MPAPQGAGLRLARRVDRTELGDKTQVMYHQVGHLRAEQCPLIEKGVSGFYDRLEEHLARC